MSKTTGVSQMRPASLAIELQTKPERWQFAQAVKTLLGSKQQAPLTLDLLNDPGYRVTDAEVTGVSCMGSHWTLSVTLPALTGIHGVLPYGYQDSAHRLRVGSDNAGLQDFYDIFSQRNLWNSYRVITRNRLVCLFESDKRASSRLSLGDQLCALAGLQKPQHIPADHLSAYAGLIGQKSTSPALLQQILVDYFAMDISVSAVPLRKHYLTDECRTGLSAWPTDTNRLGQGALVGRSTWLASDRLEIRIRVASARDRRRLERDQKLMSVMSEMCRLFLGHRVDFAICLHCPSEFLPQAQLMSGHACSVTKSAALGLGTGLHKPRITGSAEVSKNVLITLESHRTGYINNKKQNRKAGL
ncbi:type VI secretion system baseplate subunit TssG [Parendozoicomonas sp. Alg238-R29]|uniref:type VI secretion system baseplate subunit TssG n=1 Tax=Parendozoicomonas sp. Alg238-R29 TaxID=2993446 RepID=UPI00248E08DD|nr:type VI secretion system baseplate subunit TssG [Parendozoicomonas sp. Alg238-R29]